ncbi:unnamed protein product, partial [Closterium sp. NIES-54]
VTAGDEVLLARMEATFEASQKCSPALSSSLHHLPPPLPSPPLPSPPFPSPSYLPHASCWQYAVFGRVTAGDEVLARMEALPTRTEGIFVMPLNRISILATYVYDLPGAVPDPICHEDRELLRRKLVQMDDELQRTRIKCLP